MILEMIDDATASSLKQQSYFQNLMAVIHYTKVTKPKSPNLQ